PFRHGRRRTGGGGDGRSRLSIERARPGCRAHLSQPATSRRFPACILATVVVPWTADYGVDEGLFRYEIASLLSAASTPLYIFGTAGEGYAVNNFQFEQVARMFVDEMRTAGAEPMIGVISLSPGTILERIAFARDSLGVRLFQVSLPSSGALED